MFILCSATIDSTAISTLANSRVDPGMERLLLAAAGNHQAEFVALLRQIPRFTFATRKLDATAGTVLSQKTGTLFFRQVEVGGTGNATYVSLTGSKALIIPRTIQWTAPGVATLSMEMIHFSADGSTAPITVGASAGSLTTEADEWTGGGTGISQITVDFGYQVAIPPDGHLYPINHFIVAQRPLISYVTNDEAAITTAALNPGAISALTVTFNKIADGGVRGAAKTYSVTGHHHIGGVEGAKPGTVQISCYGKAGVSIG